ncbi:CTP synthase [Patescibacteria group bacterium]|nr:CTP synthase [Patescibacteria group bacterium]
MSTKYIFVTGGVCSGLGKGTAMASIGAILKTAGYSVTVLKLDPYLNIDPGTMSPFQHGEVFVTDDGYEADLDLGHYERFIDEPLSRLSNLTTGQVYQKILLDEREGAYLGRTIQVIPHITGFIKNKITETAQRTKADFLLIEIGGTVGDIEGEPYLEAARQFHRESGPDNVMFALVTLLPHLETSEEYKTKPTQMAVRELHRAGIQPDIILARAAKKIPKDVLHKIALFCDVPLPNALPCPTLKSIYEVPLDLEKNNVSELIYKHFKLKPKKVDLSAWRTLVRRIHNPKAKKITVALVGKYTAHGDAYISVHEALKAASAWQASKLNIIDIDSEKLESKDKKEWTRLKQADGIVVPGGFGNRGIEGKIMAAAYARDNKIPYFGLCLGMQIMCIEFGRRLLNTKEVNSTEFDNKTANPVIHIMPEQRQNLEAKHLGASMRLGAYNCQLQAKSKAYSAYTSKVAPQAVPLTEHKDGTATISERHRHRYEFNNEYRHSFQEAGMIFSGLNKERDLVEVAELADHPFMLGTQFHPEFQSRPLRPHPLFRDFIKACLKK